MSPAIEATLLTILQVAVWSIILGSIWFINWAYIAMGIAGLFGIVFIGCLWHENYKSIKENK